MGASDDGAWSPAAERRWIQWTVLVSLLWAARYLAVPTARSLWHFAAKIARL